MSVCVCMKSILEKGVQAFALEIVNINSCFCVKVDGTTRVEAGVSTRLPVTCFRLEQVREETRRRREESMA